MLLRPRHCEPVSKEWIIFSRPRRWLEYYELTSLIPTVSECLVKSIPWEKQA
ncbi:uncharacterized protein P174DRAFT_442706, partial [Aspergillus novofumigatus IBT 16806]